MQIFKVIAVALTLSAPVGARAQDFNTGLAAARAGDFATAVEIWRPLAEQGHVSAQNNLGLMYDNGYGVPQDYAEAVKRYRLAAEQGLADAQYHLGGMYYDGDGDLQDYAEAAKWYRLAAEQCVTITFKLPMAKQSPSSNKRSNWLPSISNSVPALNIFPNAFWTDAMFAPIEIFPPDFSARYGAADRWSACTCVSMIHSSEQPFSLIVEINISAWAVWVRPADQSKSSIESMAAHDAEAGSLTI